MKLRLLSFLLATLLSHLHSKADTFVVTSNADSGPGTFRTALLMAAANGTATYDTILFNIPNLTEAGRTILFESELPYLSSKLVIDGTSQPGNRIGVSNAGIIIKPAVNSLYIGLIMIRVSDIEIYGLCLNSIKADPNVSFTGAIYGYSTSRITIGKPSKGNMFTDCGSGIHFAPLYSNISATSDNIIIQSNIFGLINDGESAISNFQDAVFGSIRDVQIGGLQPDQANYFTAWIEGIDVLSYFESRDTGYLNIWGNYFGLSYVTKTSIATTQAIQIRGWFFPCHLTIDIRNNNLFNSVIGLQNIHPRFKIRGNKARNIWVNTSRGGTIGGPGDEKNFIGNSWGQAGISIYETDTVTITQNAIFCNIKGIQLANVTKPIINITQVNAGQISGNADPLARIELFGVDTCTERCENGRIYLGFTMADAIGNWSFSTAFNGFISATATLPSGKTSEFSAAVLNMSNVIIKHATCGNQNGAVMGAVIVSGTNWHWVDQFGNTVGNDPNLENVGPGRYRLAVGIGNSNCLTYSQFYEVLALPRPQIDASQLAVVEPSCGQPNGSIRFLNSFNSNWKYQWYRDNILFDPDFSQHNPLQNLAPGNYSLVIKLIADTNCFSLYGPFQLTNQAGPTLNTSNPQITAATCENANGSITNISSSNVTGTPTILWVDSLNNVVGTTLNLLNQPAGKYKLKFKDQSGCDTIITVFYIIPSLGKVTIDTAGKIIKSAGCTIPKGAISNIHVAGADTYQWQNLTTNTAAGNTININNLPAGNYQLTASNATGCSVTTPVIVVPPSVFIPIGVTSTTSRNAICGERNGICRINSFNRDSNNYTFRWIDSTTNQQVGTGTAIYTLGAGVYLLLATDTNGCESQIYKINLGMYPKPVFDNSGMIVTNDKCSASLGAITGIKVTGLFGPTTTYTWRDINNTIVGNTSDLRNLSAGQYYLTVVDGGLCTVQSNPIAITNSDDPGIILQYDDLVIPRNSSPQLIIKNFRTGTYFLYSDATATQLLQQNSTGIFTVGPLAADSDFYIKLETGTCSSTITHVEVKVVDVSYFAIATGFTPDNNGLNDRLNLKVIGYIDVEYFRIYNRNGEQVFVTKTVDDGWNGRLKGMDQPTGVYVWIAKGKDINGQPITSKGTFVLIR